MKSNEEWQRWGKHDPLFAVSSWPGKGKGEAHPWTDAEFYELGRRDWADFFVRWRAFSAPSGHCVEIGCGAGRITQQLATHFTRVTAVDVSEDQIAYARSHVAGEHVHFQVTDGTTLPLESDSADAVFSCHVFQHFDSLEGARVVFAEIARVCRPGATICIHLPLYDLPRFPVTPVARGLLDLWQSLSKWRADLQRRRGKLIMRGLVYERPWIVETLGGLGFATIEFSAFRMQSNGDWHEIVLARKSA